VMVFLFCCYPLIHPSIAQAQDTVAPKIEIYGKAAIAEGQFVACSYTHLPNGSGSQGYTRETMPFRPWINNAFAQIGLKTTLNSHFSALICPQIKLWNDTWDWQTMGENGSAANPFIQHMTIYLADAAGIVSFGSKERIMFNASIGVMPFKYNSDAKNLGEYLFRTGVHPAYIQTSFDFPYATLTGIQLNTELLHFASMDVLLTQETQIIPLHDWSLSILVGFKPSKFLEVGAGVMFDRLIPVSGPLNQPAFSGGAQNTFYTKNGTLDTLQWGGAKAMARLSFDPKGFLPASLRGIFGEEDGRLYAEAAALGLKSFIAYKRETDSTGAIIPGRYAVDTMMNFYSDIKQRIPVMAGFNIPAFKLLDYLSVEVEWFGWPYSPSLYNYENLVYTLPRPIIPRVVQSNGTSRSVLFTKGNKTKFSFRQSARLPGITRVMMRSIAVLRIPRKYFCRKINGDGGLSWSTVYNGGTSILKG
jgi:hypothetical protein